MTQKGVCACCGRTGDVESHHIGGRQHSDLTIDVCPICHNALTIADVHERKWRSPDPVQHVGLGILDILSRTSETYGMDEKVRMVRRIQRSLQNMSGYRHRPSSALADEPEECERATAEQMDALWRAYVDFCDLSGFPAGTPAQEAYKAIVAICVLGAFHVHQSR